MLSLELRERFFEALEREGGNVSVASRVVGVNLNTAFGWVRRAGLRGRGSTSQGGHPGRGEYERLRGEGAIRPDGRKVDYRTGVITMVTASRPPTVRSLQAELHPRFLTLPERETTADLHRRGASLRAIGRELGRPASTIKREIDAYTVGGVYRPYQAQRAWAKNRWRPTTSKLAHEGPLRDYVTSKLREEWSPEQICHALVTEFPDDESMWVSTETVRPRSRTVLCPATGKAT